jgi:hypothetical protein
VVTKGENAIKVESQISPYFLGDERGGGSEWSKAEIDRGVVGVRFLIKIE